MFGIRYCCCCGQPVVEWKDDVYCAECRSVIEEEKRENPDYLLDYLKEFCLGKDNAEFSKELEERFRISGRDLRRVISSLREQGEPICSDFHHGYFYAKDPEEIKKTVKGLNRHADGVSNTIADLRNAELKKESGEPIIRKIVIVISPSDDPEEEMVVQLI